MATWLKQSTAVDVALGPFVDSTDGVTPETALTIAQSDVRVKKNNGAWSGKSDAASGTHEENGWYELALNATDTGTLGILIIAVNVAGALPVWREFLVVPANMWDALVAGSVRLDVSVGAMQPNVLTAGVINTGAIDANAMAASAGTEIADAVWNSTRAGHATAGTFGEGVASVVGPVGSVASGGITAASFAASAIGAAAIATDAIGSAQLAASAVTEIQTGLATSAALATVQADTDDIQARLPAALVSGRMDVSVGAMAANVITAAAIATNAIDADALAADAVTEIRSVFSGTADSGTTTTLVDAALTQTNADHWRGYVLLITSGTMSGMVRVVTGFTVASDTLTFTPALPSAVSTETYELLPWGTVGVDVLAAGSITSATLATDSITAAALAAGAVTEIQTGLATSAALATVQADTDDIQARLPAALVSGRLDVSVGAMQAGVVTAAAIATGAVDADALATDAVAEIADGVWDEARAGHVTAGTFGEGVVVNSIASAAISAASIAAAAANKVADHVLRRTYANVRASSDGDTVSLRSLLGGVAKLVNKWSIGAGTLTVYHEDDTTSAGTQTLTTSAGADPIVGIDTV